MTATVRIELETMRQKYTAIHTLRLADRSYQLHHMVAGRAELAVGEWV
ncbi:MAG: hypothetical protein ACI9TF_001180 [Paracrocinitomix sp.]|jgi:hypothetical protein